MPSQTDRQNEVGRRGTPMDDALPPVDLDRRNSSHGVRRLHGSTKLAGEGRLWMMRCAPLISNAAQFPPMATILPPEMRHSRPAPCRWMTSKQARGVPAEVGRSFGPGRLDELVDVAQERA